MKKLLLVAALLLPAVMARAEDHIHPVNAATDSAVVVPDYAHGRKAARVANCTDKLGVARVAEVDPPAAANTASSIRLGRCWKRARLS